MQYVIVKTTSNQEQICEHTKNEAEIDRFLVVNYSDPSKWNIAINLTTKGASSEPGKHKNWRK